MAMAKNDERQIHRAILQYLKVRLPNCFIYHTPNGGARDSVTGAMLKADGAVAGIPDLTIIAQGGIAYWVEVKTDKKNSQLSESQKTVIGELERLDCKVAVCRSIDEAEEAVKQWGL